MIFAYYPLDILAVCAIALTFAVLVEAFVLPRWRRRRIWKAKRSIPLPPPGGVLTVNKRLSDAEVAAIKQEWHVLYGNGAWKSVHPYGLRKF